MRLGRASMPVQWLSWPGDKHFPMEALAASYRAAPGPRMVTLIPGMGHGHGAGWQPPDSYAFADSVLPPLHSYECTLICRSTGESV